MEIQSLTWPKGGSTAASLSQQKLGRARLKGFGGIDLGPAPPRQQYIRFDPCWQTRQEIERLDKVEKPLTPAAEQEQREREPPPQVVRDTETIREARQDEADRQEVAKIEAKRQGPPSPLPPRPSKKKKRTKKTLF